LIYKINNLGIHIEEAAIFLSKAAEGISNRETLNVYNIYKKQKEIEVLNKQLRASTDTFISQTNQWIQLINEINNACNELGDVENALEVIHRDIQNISNS